MDMENTAVSASSSLLIVTLKAGEFHYQFLEGKGVQHGQAN